MYDEFRIPVMRKSSRNTSSSGRSSLLSGADDLEHFLG
jgi:hypothetical protein